MADTARVAARKRGGTPAAALREAHKREEEEIAAWLAGQPGVDARRITTDNPRMVRTEKSTAGLAGRGIRFGSAVASVGYGWDADRVHRL